MLTLTEINQSIKELLDLPQVDKENVRLKAKVLNPRRKKVKFYTLIKSYLLSDPTEDFCKKEIERLDGRLQAINKEYPQDKQFGTLDEEKAFKKEFNKLWDISHIKEQIKALKFIVK